MTTIDKTPGPDRGAGPDPEQLGPDKAQYGVAALLAVVGAYTLIDATTLNVGFADPVGPKVFPFVIGTAALVLSVLLAIATARGSRGEADAGEDIDLTQQADWATVAKLAAIILITIAVVDLLGWAITGGILFAGSAWALGSRTLIRDVIVGAILSVLSWYAFYVGLGVPLSPGILDGIL